MVNPERAGLGPLPHHGRDDQGKLILIDLRGPLVGGSGVATLMISLEPSGNMRFSPHTNGAESV